MTLDAALAALAAGVPVAAATESSFGLLADARSRAAIDRVVAAKRREATKGIGLVLPSRQVWADLVVAVTPAAAALADAFWPGPLTIALEARPGLDPRLVVDGAVAVRLPAASIGAELAARFGAPLTATSANLAGEPPVLDAAAARALWPGREVFVVEGRAPGGAPSTLVDARRARVRLLRPGAISVAALARVVELEVPGG